MGYHSRVSLIEFKKSIALVAVLFSCTGFGTAACSKAETPQPPAADAAAETRKTEEALATATPKLVLDDGKIATAATTQMAVLYPSSDIMLTTPDAAKPMPALSQIKLYIGQYVAEKGKENEQKLVTQMIAQSNDMLAEQFFRKYPKSINAIAKEFKLDSTRSGAEWGDSETSVVDVVRFLAALHKDHPDSPVLKGMKAATVVAADGYRQDYGLARLPDTEGAKLGWSNDRAWHSSTAFGDGYIAAAITAGTKSTHVNDIAQALKDFDKKDLTSASQKNITMKTRIVDVDGDAAAPTDSSAAPSSSSSSSSTSPSPTTSKTASSKTSSSKTTPSKSDN